MKEDHEQRMMDKNGYRIRAACVCIKASKPNCTLLVSSSKSPNYWVIPGGGVELHESNQDAALRELEEEAGLKGRIIKSIGIFNNEERKNKTEVFLVEVNEEMENWLECKQRIRQWTPFKEAKKLLSSYKPYQSEYLKDLVEL